MKRRDLLRLAGAGLSAPLFAATPKGAIIDLRYLRFRYNHDNQLQRASGFLEKAFLPAMRRAGAGTMGFFSILIGPESPSILYVVSYPSLAALEAVSAKLGDDKEFQKSLADYYAIPGLVYMRGEGSLLRAFDGMPGIEPPPVEPGRAPRIFELRTYESNNIHTLDRKVKMFEEGEIAIFRRVGIRPVFFGRTIVGPRMPNLTYLTAFDDLASREKAWATFGADAEWKKMSSQPGVANADIVSNISIAVLRPLAFSPIR